MAVPGATVCSAKRRLKGGRGRGKGKLMALLMVDRPWQPDAIDKAITSRFGQPGAWLSSGLLLVQTIAQKPKSGGSEKWFWSYRGTSGIRNTDIVVAFVRTTGEGGRRRSDGVRTAFRVRTHIPKLLAKLR